MLDKWEKLKVRCAKNLHNTEISDSFRESRRKGLKEIKIMNYLKNRRVYLHASNFIRSFSNHVDTEYLRNISLLHRKQNRNSELISDKNIKKYVNNFVNTTEENTSKYPSFGFVMVFMVIYIY